MGHTAPRMLPPKTKPRISRMPVAPCHTSGLRIKAVIVPPS